MKKRSKVHKLSFKPEYEFVLLGISSHENDYRLSWAINNQLDIKLSKSNNLEVYNKNRNITQQFSVFTFYNEDTFNTFNLINNIGEQGFLFKEFKNIDYFFQINGEVSDYEENIITSNLKKIDIITTVFKIEIDMVKGISKLLF